MNIYCLTLLGPILDSCRLFFIEIICRIQRVREVRTIWCSQLIEPMVLVGIHTICISSSPFRRFNCILEIFREYLPVCLRRRSGHMFRFSWGCFGIPSIPIWFFFSCWLPIGWGSQSLSIRAVKVLGGKCWWFKC